MTCIKVVFSFCSICPVVIAVEKLEVTARKLSTWDTASVLLIATVFCGGMLKSTMTLPDLTSAILILFKFISKRVAILATKVLEKKVDMSISILMVTCTTGISRNK